MYGESRARSRHDLLLLRTGKLPEYRLCYGEGGLDRKGVHEHARRRCHFAGLFEPAGYQSDCKATPSLMLLCTRMSAHSHQGRGICIHQKVWRSGIFESQSNLASADFDADRAENVGLTFDDAQSFKKMPIPSQQ